MTDVGQETPQQQNGKVETSHHPETDSRREDKNYYGIPPIKHAHWTWQIPVYFWVGGIGAGAHLFSTIAQLLGHEDRALIRSSRYIVLLTMILSPVLLIWDLGRPERFYNMLRILKLRSPMSTQSWSLFIFGNLAGLIAARQAAEDGLLGRNALSGLVIQLVPARLLSVLALPFPLFVGGGILAGIAAPMALLFGRESRSKSILASVLVLLGGLAFRFAIILGGRISADDPEAYFTFASGENAPQPEDIV